MAGEVEVIRNKTEVKRVLDCTTRREIGTGSFGSVRTCGPSAARFAVKTFRPDDRGKTDEADAAAAHEARMNDRVARCLGKNTRNITLILPDDGPIKSTIVYRYPRGKNRYLVYGTCRQRRVVDLFDIALERQLSRDNVLWLATEAARKIAALHDCGMFHNDIKSENVLACVRERDGDAYIRIIDFGLSTREKKALHYPGGTFKRVTSEVKRLFEEVLGMTDVSRIKALQISNGGKKYIADSAARDRFACAVLACELVRGRVDKDHDFCEALRVLLRDLLRGDLREVARSVTLDEKTARKLSRARERG
nr:putative protein kinase [Oceanusvirus sp.]